MRAHAPWYLVGPLLGLVIVGLLWVANKPLGALGGYIDFQTWLRRPSGALGWRGFFFFGLIAGGLLHALAGGGFHPTFAYGSLDAQVGMLPAKAGVLVGAGLLMGFGARTAGGCTSGHGMCGTALASPASFVATGTFMATAVASAHAFTWILGG